MRTLVDAGFTTFDLADHYGPAEDFVGTFRTNYGEDELAERGVRFFTKWVPSPGPMDRHRVAAAFDVSRKRMRTRILDMVQLHWWDYGDSRYQDLLHSAVALSPSHLRSVSLTNFDSQRTQELSELTGGRIISNQVSYSIVDQRPARKLAPYMAAHNISIFAYGTVLGGLLSDRFLGVDSPFTRRGASTDTPAPPLDTASLRKYAQWVHGWGKWSLFQELLQVLRGIADKHSTSKDDDDGNDDNNKNGASTLTISNVAVRWVLDQPAVAGVILGHRLGHSALDHLEENKNVFAGGGWALDDEDKAAITAVTKRGRDLWDVLGDCGDEYRG